MKIMCKYAVIRFMPFAETQEFANIGIVILAPKLGFFDHKLAPGAFPRVNKFFDDIDGALYKNSRNRYEIELNRIKNYFELSYTQDNNEYFREITRSRESLINFSDIGTTLVDNIDTALDELYQRYVGRSFVTKHYRETTMNQLLKNSINTKLGLEFKNKTIDLDFINIQLPLAHEAEGIITTIKPMSFQQPRAMDLVTHGETWIMKMKRLIESKKLKPSKILFAVEEPENKDSNLSKAFSDIVYKMKEIGAEVVDYNNQAKIIEFAKKDCT